MVGDPLQRHLERVEEPTDRDGGWDRRAGGVEPAQVHVQLAAGEVVADAVGPVHDQRGLADPRGAGHRDDPGARRDNAVEPPQFLVAAGEPVHVGWQLCRRCKPFPAVGHRQLATQQRAVQATQFRAGIDAELLGEPLLDGGVAVEGLSVPAGGVQRAQEQNLERLGERVLRDEVGQHGEHLVGAFEVELERGPSHGGVEPPSVPGVADLRGPLTLDARQRRAAPQTKCLRERVGPLLDGACLVAAALDQARRNGAGRRCRGRPPGHNPSVRRSSRAVVP